MSMVKTSPAEKPDALATVSVVAPRAAPAVKDWTPKLASPLPLRWPNRMTAP
jgi:hypothetical protein